MAVVTLEQLFRHAEMSNYGSQTWFRGASLKAPHLFCEIEDDATRIYLEKRFLPLFRELIPALELRPLLKAAPVKAKPRAFKAAFYERQKQGDFL